MNNRRLLGPPLTFVVLSGLGIAIATVALLIDQGPVWVAFGALVALAVWRTLGASVTMEGDELVVRNVLRTFRLPIAEIDIRPRVVDPRLEYYAAGDTTGLSEIPTASDDNTAQSAKWYVLEHGKDRYFIDALMGRWPANHERLAWRLRQEIRAARGEAGDGVTTETS